MAPRQPLIPGRIPVIAEGGPFANSNARYINGNWYIGDFDAGNYIAISPEGILSQNGKAALQDPEVIGSMVMEKASGLGIKVDRADPTFGWRDLLGEIKLHGIGANEPVYSVYRGALRAYQFNTINDDAFLEYHMPHDYVAGTDIFVHVHWSHNSALVTSGSVTWGLEVSYAKGHNQAAFIDPITTSVTEDASLIQYQHLLSEVKLSDSSPSASQIDTDDLEPDGLILLRAFLSANSMNGGVDPFLHYVDIHYQSTNISTKEKAPDFYA